MNKQMRISNNKKDLGKGAELLQMKDYNIKVKKKREDWSETSTEN